jgi:hypothetical protein
LYKFRNDTNIDRFNYYARRLSKKIKYVDKHNEKNIFLHVYQHSHSTIINQRQFYRRPENTKEIGYLEVAKPHQCKLNASAILLYKIHHPTYLHLKWLLAGRLLPQRTNLGAPKVT